METMNIPFTMKKMIKKPFNETIEAVKEAFRAEGFGILTEIDVQATLKNKIGADLSPYTILGVCNPGFAHRALVEDREIGVMMPCNVAVYEDNGQTVIIGQDPGAIIEIAGKQKLSDLAQEATISFKRAINSLKEDE